MNRESIATKKLPAYSHGTQPLLNRRTLLLCAAYLPALTLLATAVEATPTGIGLAGLPSGLNGAGVNVAQVEANTSSSPTDRFEANPASSSINNSGLPITYIDFNGHQSSTVGATYTIGSATYSDSESSHADIVGGNFYGSANGVAPDVAHVDNYDAGYFQNNLLGSASSNINTQTYVQPATLNNDKVINQSFVNTFSSGSTSAQVQAQQDLIDAEYDITPTPTAQYLSPQSAMEPVTRNRGRAARSTLLPRHIIRSPSVHTHIALLRPGSARLLMADPRRIS